MQRYTITIGTNSYGTALVGRAECRAQGAIITQQVYGSQLGHRVVARDGGGDLHICTPTHAGQKGWDVQARFPAADGSRRHARGAGVTAAERVKGEEARQDQQRLHEIYLGRGS
jgi:hypothetical protein